MKKLIFALFVTALIASCSSSTGPDGDVPTAEYPFINQTFKVVSGEEAEWQGVSGMQKVISSGFFMADSSDSTETDTTFINQPDKYGLEVTESFGDSLYQFKFIDSTITRSNVDPEVNPEPDSLFGHGYQAMESYFAPNYSEIKLRYPFSCDSTYNPVKYAHINYTKEDSLVRVYAINVEGALPTISHIMCEN